MILTGGRIDDDFALSFLKKEKFDEIIVVDGALAVWDRMADKLLQCKDKPANLICVGDFDTIDHKILHRYEKRSDISLHRFKPEKDYTDTEIAVQLAIAHGAERKDEKTEIVLLGATGSRLDHSLANLHLLEQIKAAGMQGVIVDKHNRLRLLEGCVTLKKSEAFGDYVSLIPITPVLTSVTLKGFKYPLTGQNVDRSVSLCVSNELIEATGEIDIQKGSAWLIESRD